MAKKRKSSRATASTKRTRAGYAARNLVSRTDRNVKKMRPKKRARSLLKRR